MILAIETSSPRHSICLGRLDAPADTVAVARWESRGRSGRLLSEVDVLRGHLPHVRLIAIGVGPGSFSGIRAAISVARGLRAVLGTPLIGICSADATAASLPRVSRLGVFADAKRNEFYITEYALGQRLRGPATIPRAMLEDHLSKLTLAVSAEPIPAIPERAFPDAVALAQLAAASFRANPERNDDPEPIYLREPTPQPPKP